MTRGRRIVGKKGATTLSLFQLAHAEHNPMRRPMEPHATDPGPGNPALFTLSCPCGDAWISEQGPAVPATKRTGEVYGRIE